MQAEKIYFEREKKLLIGLHSTILTQFMLPNSLATQSQQEGSFCQFPSTRKRYSYLPGFRERLVFHIPFLSFFIGFARVSQLLKSAAKYTFSASGARNSNCTFFVLVFPAISPPPSVSEGQGILS